MKREEQKLLKEKADKLKDLKKRQLKDPKSLTFAERNILNIVAKKEKHNKK